MDSNFLATIYQAHSACRNCPTPELVAGFFDGLISLMFPNFSSQPVGSQEELAASFAKLATELENLIGGAPPQNGRTLVETFFSRLPKLYAQLSKDVDAIYQGDPAAVDREEVIRAYPGFYAIAAYRIAHELLILGVSKIPRSITEHAHSHTGIDIHPRATIGERFCIDHGTGVVIGETTIIGDDVKLYQGVTLGALSVDKEQANTKRHPTIGNRVVIYAGATVLGGKTHIGDDCIIGGNTWLTKSVPANSRVYYKAVVEHEVRNNN
ncbi:MAG: serine O-acetyltransferase [Bacteroidota bacterium]